MADRPYTGRKTICELYKVCSTCKKLTDWLNLVNSYQQEKKGLCLDCRRIYARKKYAENPQKYIASQRERMARLEAEGKAKDVKRKYRQAQRAKYLAAGLTIGGKKRKIDFAAIAKRRARLEILRWRKAWIKHNAPEPCVAAWYKANGKPWNNPRLTVGDKFKVRYNNDDVFRAKEILKAQNRKVSRAARIAKLSDGSVTPQTLGALFGEARFCVYCVQPLKDSYDKTVDHVNPLYLGGKHSMDNLVICCRSCNSRKGRKGFIEWLIAEKPILNLPR